MQKRGLERDGLKSIGFNPNHLEKLTISIYNFIILKTPELLSVLTFTKYIPGTAG